jgi:hypothetical protein
MRGIANVKGISAERTAVVLALAATYKLLIQAKSTYAAVSPPA